MTLIHVRRRALLASVALSLLFAACGGNPVAADAQIERAQKALAPGGKLRVGVYPGSPTSMLRDAVSGETRGVTYELGADLARRLGVPVEYVEYPRVAEVVSASAARRMRASTKESITPMAQKKVMPQNPQAKLPERSLITPSDTANTSAPTLA